MVKRYELSDAQWRRIEGLLPGKLGDPGRTAEDNRLFVNGVLWVLRSGVTCRSDMANGKASTPASPDGPRAASGNAYSTFSPKTARTNTSCSTLRWFVPTSRPRPEKGGPKPGSGAIQRRIDQQNPYACRCTWSAAAPHSHRRTSPRHRHRPGAAGGHRRRRRNC